MSCHTEVSLRVMLEFRPSYRSVTEGETGILSFHTEVSLTVRLEFCPVKQKCH